MPGHERSPALPSSRDRRFVAAVGLLLALLVAFAGLILDSRGDARRALDERFVARASLTASFARNYIDDLARRERHQAKRLLSGEDVGRGEFEAVIAAFDFEAAVLLDERGHLLQVWPSKPDLIGQEMTLEYQHLWAAAEGRVGISDLVPSASGRIPTAAVAVPYETESGRRVLSGAFSPSTTPLGSYLGTVVPVTGGNAFLVDGSGQVVAMGHSQPAVEEALAGSRPGVRQVETELGSLTFATAPVPGTSWRVVLTAPSEGLYEPVARGGWGPWALLAALSVAGFTALILFARLERERARAETSARIDALTELPNRRAMEEMLRQAEAQALRHHHPLTMLFLDLDHFKVINDTFGHDGGDIVLRRVAERLRDAMRTGDVVGRWGGEEFVIVLPQTDLEGGTIAAERFRTTIATADIPGLPAGVGLTASIGLAVLRQSGDMETLLREADAALYRAKASGRNQSVAYGAVMAPARSSGHAGVGVADYPAAAMYATNAPPAPLTASMAGPER